MNVLRVAVLFLAVIALPSLAGAQAVVSADPAAGAVTESVSAVAQAGPRIETERLGVAPVTRTAEAGAASAAAQPRMGESAAMMIVGGAALVAGLIIGGDAGTVLALGGAVIGLIGLYQYLR